MSIGTAGLLSLEKRMSAHNLTEFLPPPVDGESEERDDPSWLEGRSWVPEIYSHDPETAPAARKRHLHVALWAEGRRAEVPIVNVFS